MAHLSTAQRSTIEDAPVMGLINVLYHSLSTVWGKWGVFQPDLRIESWQVEKANLPARSATNVVLLAVTLPDLVTDPPASSCIAGRCRSYNG